MNCISYGDRDQHARPLHLPHVCDAADIVCLEAPYDLPAGADDSYVAIEAPEEEAVGPRADAGYVVALEEGARVVVGEFDLADFEEVEGLPLCVRARAGSVKEASRDLE